MCDNCLFDMFDAAKVAAEWHSGQFSALYKMSSSGYIDSDTEREFEKVVSECERRVKTGDRVGNHAHPTDLLSEAQASLDYVRCYLSTHLILEDGTVHEGRLQYRDGKPVVDEAECGECGFVWNDALITGITPVPSGRCPNEYSHEG